MRRCSCPSYIIHSGRHQGVNFKLVVCIVVLNDIAFHPCSTQGWLASEELFLKCNQRAVGQTVGMATIFALSVIPRLTSSHVHHALLFDARHMQRDGTPHHSPLSFPSQALPGAHRPAVHGGFVCRWNITSP